MGDIEDCTLLTREVDIVTDCCGGCLVNTNGNDGKEIDKTHIHRYHQALNGKLILYLTAVETTLSTPTAVMVRR